MAITKQDAVHSPNWTWAAPLLGVAVLGLKFAGLISLGSSVLLGFIVILVGFTVFAAVHHADVLAVRVGEPFGSILLAIAITVMEVAVILSVMAADTKAADTVARDTVFAAVMIVLNGVVGLCLLVGGIRHHEQGFRTDGAAAMLGVIVTTATFALILPNFTTARAGPVYSEFQLGVIGMVSLVLYLVFLFVQTSSHKQYFLDDDGPTQSHARPGPGMTLFSAVMLTVALVVVILLAKALTPTIETVVFGAGLPVSFVGVIIAMLILMPETVASLRFAARNRLQSSLNAALGSALASIAMTVPAVAVASLIMGQPLVLGVNGESMVLLVLTLFTSALTLATGRTTVLQGAIHLMIFAVFLLLSAVP